MTEIGIEASTGQLNLIGVFGDKQDYVIEFSRESAFANNIRLNPVYPARSIFSIPRRSILDNADYFYTVMRLK